MKFNEKLIELRKKSGLSQEELGYKLNVTRQTISKWELGQTTPEMDKLIELGKLFNLSVDDLINESVDISGQAQKIDDRPIGESMNGNKKGFIIAVVIMVVMIGFAAYMFKTITGQMGSMFESVGFGSQKDIMNQASEMQSQILETGKEMQNQMLQQGTEMQNNMTSDTQNEISEMKKEIDADSFNIRIESYAGTVQGAGFACSALDEIMESNNKNDRKITVVYGKTKTADVSKIRALKRKIEKVKRLELYYEYDEDGYIYQAVFEKISD